MKLDSVIPQGWERYTEAEHRTWDLLFKNQIKKLARKVVPEFLEGISILGLDEPGIPNFERLSDRLLAASGWRIVAVPGLISDQEFFAHLANRRFVSGRFIRQFDQVDYLQEPDIFHDVFGHVPLLANPVFADYMQAYGEGGLRAEGYGALKRLARIYWYTVEFGLIRSGEGLKIYGAGIASSGGETAFSLESSSPHRLGFNLARLMRTPYRIDDYQQAYFVIDSFEDLLHQTLETDFEPLYSSAAELPDYELDEIVPEDVIFNIGTQAHAGATSLHAKA